MKGTFIINFFLLAAVVSVAVSEQETLFSSADVEQEYSFNDLKNDFKKLEDKFKEAEKALEKKAEDVKTAVVDTAKQLFSPDHTWEYDSDDYQHQTADSKLNQVWASVTKDTSIGSWPFVGIIFAESVNTSFDRVADGLVDYHSFNHSHVYSILPYFNFMYCCFSADFLLKIFLQPSLNLDALKQFIVLEVLLLK